jgi:hypothetical protein
MARRQRRFACNGRHQHGLYPDNQPGVRIAFGDDRAIVTGEVQRGERRGANAQRGWLGRQGAASSGGTANFTTAFAARTILQTDLPNVGLSIAGGVATPTVTATPANAAIAAFTSGQAAGGAGSSNFLTSASLAALSIALSGNTASMNTGVTQTTMDFAVKYVDVIRATKD